MTSDQCVIEALKPPLRMDTDGVFRVGGTRVRLETIVNAYTMGHSPEEIASKYPAVYLSDIYTVLAYYLQQGSSVEAYVAKRNLAVGRAEEELEAQLPAAEMRARLLSRLKNAAS